MSLTYVLVVLVVGVVALVAAHRRGLLGGGTGGLGAGAGWLREQIVGVGRGRSDDLVERLARCLADETVVLGASYAVPGFIGVVLPRGVYRAASANKPQLIAEILDRYAELMADRARREGRRQEFYLPGGYTLRLVLACGPVERCIASFEPIGDVHAALGLQSPPALAGSGRPAGSGGFASVPGERSSVLTGHLTGQLTGLQPDGGVTSMHVPTRDVTVQRIPLRDSGAGFLLTVDGAEVAQCRLGSDSSGVVVIGRASSADLRCPNSLKEVSREHAELTCADGRVWIEDKHSANGTWLQAADGAPRRLVPGELSPVGDRDTIWLDEDHRATVTQLTAT